MVSSVTELGERLRKARQSSGLSQAEVAKRIGVSRATVTKIENGGRSVSGLELQELASIYGRSVDSFLSPTEEVRPGIDSLINLLPQSRNRKESIEDLQNLHRSAALLTELESLVGADRSPVSAASYTVAAPTDAWEAMQQGLWAAAEERRRQGIGSAPVRELTEQLTLLGIRAAPIRLPHEVACVYFSRPEVGTVVAVNRSMGPHRRRHLYAHGLGHVLFESEEPALACHSENREFLHEVRANAFAAGYLVPDEGVYRFLGSVSKKATTRGKASVFDVFADVGQRGEPEDEVPAIQRADSGSHVISLLDVIQLSTYFGVSPALALHRLRNLRFNIPQELEDTVNREEASDHVRDVKTSLEGEGVRINYKHDSLRRKIIALACEAHRREVIPRDRWEAIAREVGVLPEDFQALLAGISV